MPRILSLGGGSITTILMLSIGIIGFGRIGAEHVGWLERSASARTVAVADTTPARQDLARARGLRVYDDVNEMLNDPQVGGVLVATPTAMHFEHATLALRAGKHVMVEKPMALDLPQAQALVEAAERAGRMLSVFHNRRWDIDYLTVRNALASGVLGKIINIESRLGQFASCVGPAAKEYRPGWRNEAAFGGGGLYDWGSHFVDQMWRLLWPARPVNVFAQLRGNVWTQNCDDFARVCIDFDNGAATFVEINTTTAHRQARWHLDGSEGSVFSPPSPDFDTSVWSNLEFFPATNGSPRKIPRAAVGLSETDIWDRFAAAVEGGHPPAVSARSVLPTMALLEAARRSGHTGSAIAMTAQDWVYE